jgi:hypothetical protein
VRSPFSNAIIVENYSGFRTIRIEILNARPA